MIAFVIGPVPYRYVHHRYGVDIDLSRSILSTRSFEGQSIASVNIHIKELPKSLGLDGKIGSVITIDDPEEINIFKAKFFSIIPVPSRYADTGWYIIDIGMTDGRLVRYFAYSDEYTDNMLVQVPFEPDGARYFVGGSKWIVDDLLSGE